MSIYIVFTRFNRSLTIYGVDGSQIIRATAQMVREPIFPAIGNVEYVFENTDQNRNICHFRAKNHQTGAITSDPRSMIHLTFAAGIVAEQQGGILVTDGNVATWRGLIELLAVQREAILNIINSQPMKPIGPIYSSGIRGF